MTDEKLQSELARILGTKKSRVEIVGKASDDSDTKVVACKVGFTGYLVVIKEGCTPQVYRRVQR